jgi:Fe-S cluster assembly ATPase SufC
MEIPGVTNANFLRAALQARLPQGEELEATDYYAKLYKKMDLLEMPRAFTSRAVNEGFSGGEKKRNEILQMAMLEMDDRYRDRGVNDGFSGGEKKRNEILQMAILDPKVSFLDETDSGLDIDALRIVAHGINQIMSPEKAVILVTHYQRLLDYIKPTYVHVLRHGKIILSGGPELALKLEEQGYDWIEEN